MAARELHKKIETIKILGAKKTIRGMARKHVKAFDVCDALKKEKKEKER